MTLIESCQYRKNGIVVGTSESAIIFVVVKNGQPISAKVYETGNYYLRLKPKLLVKVSAMCARWAHEGAEFDDSPPVVEVSEAVSLLLLINRELADVLAQFERHLLGMEVQPPWCGRLVARRHWATSELKKRIRKGAKAWAAESAVLESGRW